MAFLYYNSMTIANITTMPPAQILPHLLRDVEQQHITRNADLCVIERVLHLNLFTMKAIISSVKNGHSNDY